MKFITMGNEIRSNSRRFFAGGWPMDAASSVDRMSRPCAENKKSDSYPWDNYLILIRAANGARTRDPQLGKLMLYQLSYCRINRCKCRQIFLFFLILTAKI